VKKTTIILWIVLTSGIKVFGQPCGVVQILSAFQCNQINAILTPLDVALKNEDIIHIDSLSNALISAFSVQGGRPDGAETYYPLVSNDKWLDLNQAITLSRALIAKDNQIYADLWKAAKGMAPPAYLPHSLYLRSSAEIAAGLLQIADKESDLTRKATYQSWATRALDSLATMQLPSGAFPFPDLRTYGDPVFTSILNDFLKSCGADSVNVLKNGFIVDDKGSGEFKFDAGVIANAYYQAYFYTGNINYKNTAIRIGNYLKPLTLNLNYNYNTFVSLGLTRTFQLTSDTTFLNRAVKNLRYGTYPGQITNGRWVDGHNANSRYHSIIIQNITQTIPLLPLSYADRNGLISMHIKAVRNMAAYTFSCGSATGFRWLLKAYGMNGSILPVSLKDSVTNLIGRHINQSNFNGKYLDVPTMGEYMELVEVVTGIQGIAIPKSVGLKVYPNPTSGIVNLDLTLSVATNVSLLVFDMFGKLIKQIDLIRINNQLPANEQF